MEKYKKKSKKLEKDKNEVEGKYANAKKIISIKKYEVKKLDKELGWQINDNESKTKKIEELTITVSQLKQKLEEKDQEIIKLKELLSKNLNKENEKELKKENCMPKNVKEDEKEEKKEDEKEVQKEDEKEEKKKGNEENDESSESKKRKKRKKRKILKNKDDADLESIIEALEENDE